MYEVDSYLISDEFEYNDSDGTNIKGGVTIELDQAYRLNDNTSDVEIEVGNSLMGLAGEEPLRQIISIQ